MLDSASTGIQVPDEKSLRIQHALESAGLAAQEAAELCKQTQSLHSKKISKQTIQAFAELTKAQLSYDSYPEAYQAVFDHPKNSRVLLAVFIALRNAGLSFQADTQAYRALTSFPRMLQVENATAAVSAFAALNKVGIDFHSHYSLCSEILQAPNVEDFISTVNSLYRMGVPINANMCSCLLSMIDPAHSVVEVFHLLKKYKIPYEKDVSLCEEVARNCQSPEQLEIGFQAVHAFGVTYEVNSLGFTTLIHKPHVSASIAKTLNTLRLYGINFENSTGFYYWVFQQFDQKYDLEPLLSEMAVSGINYTNHARFYHEYLIFCNTDVAIYVLTELRQAGYEVVHQPEIFSKFLEILKQHSVRFSYVNQLLAIVKEFSSKQRLLKKDEPGHSEQNQELIALLSAVESSTDLDEMGSQEDANTCARAHRVLKEAGIAESMYPELFSLFSQVSRIAGSTELFKVLKKMNVPYQRDLALFRNAIELKAELSEVEALFTVLKENAVNYEQDPKLCLIAIRLLDLSLGGSATIKKVFATLKSHGIPFETNSGICMAAFANVVSHETYGLFFHACSAFDIVPKAHPELCIAVMNNPWKAGDLLVVLDELKKYGVVYRKNPKLFEFLFDMLGDDSQCLLNEGGPEQDRTHRKLGKVLFEMQVYGIVPAESPGCVNKFTLFIHDNLVTHVLAQLRQLGFHGSTHKNLTAMIFTLLGESAPRFQAILKILAALKAFVSEHSLVSTDNAGFENQQQQLEKIVEDNSKQPALVFGPLQKSWTTSVVEEIVERLSDQETFARADIAFENDCYYLTLPCYNKFNLTLLLNNSNLSHVDFGIGCLDKLAQILTPLLKKIPSRVDPLLSKHHDLQKTAFGVYFEYGFKNINAFFRAEEMDLSDEKYIAVNDLSQNLKVVFLLGCVLNAALNKLVGMPDQRYIKDTLLDRKERLTEADIEQRNPNSWRFPALTSFSAALNGSQLVDKENKQRTKLVNGSGYIVNQFEMEIMYPHGTQVQSKRVAQDLIYLEIVCSPQLEPYQFWSDVALDFADQNHLRQIYKDERVSFALQLDAVARDNHGVVHTHRTRDNVKVVAHYWAQFAQDASLKEYCQQISADDLEWLRVAAVFLVTGRESEVSFKEDPVKYQAYKKASAEHFKRFIAYAKSPTSLVKITMSDATRDELAEVIEHLGNPEYAKSINKRDEPSRSRCNFYYHILKPAHDIDLMRCYSAAEFAGIVQGLQGSSRRSTEQQACLNEMLRFGAERMKAHGNRLQCDIQANGTLVDVQVPYLPIFTTMSRSIKALDAKTNTVLRPQLKMA